MLRCEVPVQAVVRTARRIRALDKDGVQAVGYLRRSGAPDINRQGLLRHSIRLDVSKEKELLLSWVVTNEECRGTGMELGRCRGLMASCVLICPCERGRTLV